MRIPSILSICGLAALTACGGGGGGTEPPAAEAPPTVATVAPGAGMDWRTAADTALRVRVLDAGGAGAAGAALRVFTLSRQSPQGDGGTTDPVPVSLLASAETGPGGDADLALRLPAHLGEVLLVATSGDARVSQAVDAAALAAGVELRLAR